MKGMMEALNKFAETTVGKAIVIGSTLLIAAVAFFVTYRTFFATPTGTMPAQQTEAETEGTTEITSSTTASSSQEESRVSKPSQNNFFLETGFEVFSKEVLRDPFTPMVIETTPTTATAVEKKEDIMQLVFLGTTYDEGRVMAVVSYEGAVSSISPGETVGPYLLISVDETTARFLYGDMPFTLQVGQSFKP
mgnify:CR=1 FL=1